MTDLAPLLPWLFGVVAVGVLVGGFLLEQKRRERMLLFARNRGWRHVGEDPVLVDRWDGDPFGKGERRRAASVLTGVENGRPFTAFDYTYVTRSTDSKGHSTTTTHRYGVCAVPLPVPLGTVEVLRDSVLTRAAGAMGLMTSIELESEDFNRRFRVRASDRRLASDVLSPRTMHFLISAEPEAWRLQDGHILSWRAGRLDPAEVVRTCAVLGRVLDGIPSFVWKDAGPRRASGYDPQP